MDDNKIPNHVGIIMDGNRRWAAARGKKRSYGHKVGTDNIKTVAEVCFSLGVKVLTLYAFSTENFSRTEEEVSELMSLIKTGITKYGEYSIKNGICFKVSGDLGLLNDGLRKEIEKQVKKTQGNTEKILNICIAYGGRQEICRAFNAMKAEKIDRATPEEIERHLYTADLPPLDLIIRTGGEYRLSNFLLWQAAYAELYFTPILWPDFNKEEVERALSAFAQRQRRFGKN